MTSGMFSSLDYTPDEVLFPTHLSHARPQSLDECLDLIFAKIERIPEGTHRKDAIGPATTVSLHWVAGIATVYCLTNSTRRFRARPASVSLVATGAKEATPLASRRLALIL